MSGHRVSRPRRPEGSQGRSIKYVIGFEMKNTIMEFITTRFGNDIPIIDSHYKIEILTILDPSGAGPYFSKTEFCSSITHNMIGLTCISFDNFRMQHYLFPITSQTVFMP